MLSERGEEAYIYQIIRLSCSECCPEMRVAKPCCTRILKRAKEVKIV